MAIDLTALREYRRLLQELRLHLARFGVSEWPERLANWTTELDAVLANPSSEAIISHVARTQRATGGMGSIGDIFISPEAGDRIVDDEMTIRSVNNKLRQLVASLYTQTVLILGRDVRR